MSKESLNPSKEEFINYCVDRQFEQHQIKNNADAVIDPAQEVSFWIKKGKDGRMTIQVDRYWPTAPASGFKDAKIWELRVLPTLNFLRWVVEKASLELDCRFIYFPADGFAPHRPKISLLGHSTSLLFNHLAIPDSHFLAYAGLNSRSGNSHDDRYLSQLITNLRSLTSLINKKMAAGEELEVRAKGMEDKIPPLKFPLLPPRNSQAIFRGEHTSDQRLRLSYTALGYPSLDIKVNTFQNSAHDELVWGSFLSAQEHLRYPCILDMYGSVNSWDRSCWVLPSSSALLAVKPEAPLVNVHTWYSHFLYERGIVPQLTEEQLFGVKDFSCFSHLNEAQQRFSHILLDHDTLLSYMSKLLKRYNEEFNS